MRLGYHSLLLSEAIQGRDNNFNLVRLVLALSVLIHHAFKLTAHDIVGRDLLSRFLGQLGETAVNGFFIVSGLLVTQSLLRGTSVPRFLLARALRVYPGLWVMLVLTTVALASLSSIDAPSYFIDPATWSYVAKNATALMTTYDLPGVFRELHNSAVNGSLWSLKFEMVCYIVLALIAAIGAVRRPWMVVLGFTGCAILVSLPGETVFLLDLGRRLAFCFGCGVVAAVFADRIRLGWLWAAALLLVALACDRTILAPAVWTIAFGYAILCFAYLPAGAIRNYNRLPDISYGLYIYAFPIQQALIQTGLGAEPLANMLLATPLTMLCATASWYAIERPALDLKKALSRRRPVPA